ncbi:hypothetical protein GCM10010329_86160 [Streptomyces spiroverticillatus]|uniref:Secreted protein n=1 Tax=Streptomyces finlayi TaxID=67296 RepID=A0A918XAK3_9ACTN|nr:hypothetical protein [Streptomyces finlayi]GHA50961.1 hypothetical protein GCM10010329_86160 [Streptomyces spiroverticillatus]GHD20046.1 hypothetical protein GCM10010334_84220 [Streptomyces finlayi]
MKSMGRTAAAALLTGAAAAGMLATGAGAASASGYANSLWHSFTTSDSGSNWNECNSMKRQQNDILQRSGNRDPQVYYYCAPGEFGNGAQHVNLWFRHRA